MKSRFLMLISTFSLFAAIPSDLAAQKQQPNKQQPRYKLIDIGTLGGPTATLSTESAS